MRSNKIILVILAIFFCPNVWSQQVINLKPGAEDMTPVLRELIDGLKGQEVKIVLEKGTYKFMPDYSYEKYCFVTNHENGLKKIIFPMENFESVEIEGNGAELIFHGQVMPFLFEDCNKVTLKNLSINWDVPFTFQGEVVGINKEEGWRDIKPHNKGFSYQVSKGKLTFPNIDGFKFSSMGSTLAFNPETKDVAHGAWDMSSNPEKVEKLKNGNLRFYEKLKHYPEVGTVLNSKGPKGENRYAPAVHVKSSSNILIEGVVVHHALGMGFLMERSEDATISKCGIYTPEGSRRVVSIIADATHFCNCKGDILVEDCRFESMLDDGTNVHGTYVEVHKILDDHALIYELKHFQQMGFEFAGNDDEIWFIHSPDPQKQSVNVVESLKVINDRFVRLSFKDPLPNNLKVGDVLENKTWNPTFTMRGCTIQHHRARNIVLKTPEKILIENNNFSSMMSSVLFRGETFYWFESGAVEDVTIRNNKFKYVAYSGAEHAVMYITPRLGKSFNVTEQYDRNIVFENNEIETFDNRIVWADRVDGLIVRENTIKKVDSHEQLYPEAPLFQFDNCKNTIVTKNIYKGSYPKAFEVDDSSAETLKVKGNRGFKYKK